MLHATNIAFAYDTVVLSDIHMEVPKGQIVALLGPNGAGKSTLLRIVAGLEKSLAGEVILQGRNIQLYTAKERAQLLGFLPQLEEMDTAFSVQQVVQFGRAPWQNFLGLADTQGSMYVERALEILGLFTLADRAVSSLSGGEQQRVHIARIFSQNPEVFVLDEPTSALDYKHQIQIMDALYTVCKIFKKTVLFASHDINLVSQYADQVVLLQEGRVLQSGSPQTLITKEIVEGLYKCSMTVQTNSYTNKPQVLPLSLVKK